jgi:hypothetical protein
MLPTQRATISGFDLGHNKMPRRLTAQKRYSMNHEIITLNTNFTFRNSMELVSKSSAIGSKKIYRSQRFGERKKRNRKIHSKQENKIYTNVITEIKNNATNIQLRPPSHSSLALLSTSIYYL